MLDIAVLAASAVGNILVPFFQRTGEKVASDIAEKVGDDAATYASETAMTLWERIKQRFSGSDGDRMVAERFKNEPEVVAPLFESDLKRKLAEDPGFAEELAALLERPGPAGSGNVMQIFGDGGIVDARGAHVEGGFIAGYVGTVHSSAPPSPSPAPTDDS
jgi:hypothetical protein